jgi:signal transduction histidine kinase
MRAMLLELRPAALAEQRLDRLLEQLAEAMMSRTRTPVRTTLAKDCALPDEAKIALYRLAQEALNNVAKHARASAVEVSLVCAAEQVTLGIRDDGCGFDREAVEAGQLGLAIMRERAQAIGAELEIRGEPGQGTEIVVRWRRA